MKYLLLALLTSTAQAEGNDTYNFYFQKAPGPVTVNQGAAPTPGVSNTVVTPAAPTVGTSIAAAPTEEASRRKRFYLGLGFAMSGARDHTTKAELYSGAAKEYKNGQLEVKAEFDLTDLISVTGSLYKLQRPGTYTMRYYSDGNTSWAGYLPESQRPKIPSTVLDYSAGAAINFVRLPTTTFSAIGGITTLPYVQYDKIPGTRFSAVLKGIQHQKVFYAGGRVRLLADNVWGIEGSYRQLIGAKRSIAEALLTFAL